MINIKEKGSFKETAAFLTNVVGVDIDDILEFYGKQGIELLEEITPKRTGLTSRSWYYEIEKTDESIKLVFYNDNIQDGSNIAILIQYGFVTSTGYQVKGRDYINPVTKLLLDNMANNLFDDIQKYNNKEFENTKGFDYEDLLAAIDKMHEYV